MGIRIEDSVCVGEDAPLVLSVEAAKEVSYPNPAEITQWNGPDPDQIVDIETLGESYAQ